jgi:uncharacterized protein (DUF58 family)
MAETLLDKDFVARLEYLYIVTRELFVGHVSAERLSKKFGVGIEFADYRAYTPGDDFRYIDWSAFARRDEILIKLFTEEQAARIYLMIDASRSMSVGLPEKLLFAKKVAAALGYISLSNLDPVTLLVFDQTLREQSRVFQGRAQLQPMLNFLERVRPGGKATGMGEAVRQFVQRFHGGGVVILLSDFFDRSGYEEMIRQLHYHRFGLIAIQVNDREEVEPTFSGDLELVDSESGERKTVQMTPELRVAYHETFEEHYAELARLCTIQRRDYLRVVTDTAFDQVIFEVFRRRGILK